MEPLYVSWRTVKTTLRKLENSGEQKEGTGLKHRAQKQHTGCKLVALLALVRVPSTRRGALVALSRVVRLLGAKIVGFAVRATPRILAEVVAVV